MSNIYENIEKDLITPEEKKKLEQWFQEYKLREEQKNKKIKQLLSNTDYLQWLENFTNDNETFSDDDFIYFPDKISDIDKENVECLCLLYEGIHKYARKNYIYPMPRSFGNYYNIKLNNIGYQIGILVGQGTVFFCSRVQIEKDEDFINFNDIIDDKLSDKAVNINNNLDMLSKSIISLYESGVPVEAILSTSKDVLDKLKSQNDLGHSKTLKK